MRSLQLFENVIQTTENWETMQKMKAQREREEKRTKKDDEEEEGCTWKRKGTTWQAMKMKQGLCYSVWNS